MKLNVKDLFVVKYKENAQNYLDMHQDGSFLSFNILLSDPIEFEGGGTYFDDGLTAHLEQGDILIHSSRVKHSGLPIVKGTRYLLVGFLDIFIQEGD
jgi:predicted 2-oxoglutarate/Fe(II)-dependent dioxygenase YbiX